MNKWLAIVVLVAMLLAVTGSALAEDTSNGSVNMDELLGVWQSDEDDRLLVYILPDSYATRTNVSKAPDLYVEGNWQVTSDRCIYYKMPVNKRMHEKNTFLDSLLGVSMSNAIQTIKNFGGGIDDEYIADCFDYSNANIGVKWIFSEDEEGYSDYTTKALGTFYAMPIDDGDIILYWFDEYDPHIPGIVMQRLSVEAPSAEALTEGVLRPVIDMAGGTELQTAVTLARWASEKKCMRMDGKALADNLHAAFAALNPTDAQAFRDHYGKFTTAMLDALGLNPKTSNNPDRDKPFKDVGLEAAIKELATNVESQRSLDILNAALEGIIG